MELDRGSGAGCAGTGRTLRLRHLSLRPRFAFDADYLQRLIAEDPETERHFTSYFGDLLSLKLRSRLRSAAQVEDARQETFVRVLTALKKKGSLESPESLGAFVNAVCNNVLLETYRSGGRADQLDDERDEPEAGEPTAEYRVPKTEERFKVRAAIAALPPKDRELIRWLFLQNRSKDDICRELNVDRDYLRVLSTARNNGSASDSPRWNRGRDHMTHQEAADTLAAERYLLGELPAGDREAFEAHYFSCDVCADDLRSAAALLQGVKDGLADTASPADVIPMPLDRTSPANRRVVSLGRPALGRGGGAGRDCDLPGGVGGAVTSPRHLSRCARSGAAASREPRQRAFRRRRLTGFRDARPGSERAAPGRADCATS